MPRCSLLYSTHGSQLNKDIDNFFSPASFIILSSTTKGNHHGRNLQFSASLISSCSVTKMCIVFSNRIFISLKNTFRSRRNGDQRKKIEKVSIFFVGGKAETVSRSSIKNGQLPRLEFSLWYLLWPFFLWRVEQNGHIQ